MNPTFTWRRSARCGAPLIGLTIVALSLLGPAHHAQAAAFSEDPTYGNNVGRELAAGGNKVWIDDSTIATPVIRNVTWNFGAAGVNIDGNMSVAPTAAQAAAVRAAFDSLSIGTSNLIFTEAATAAVYNPNAGGGGAGNIIDVFIVAIAGNTLGYADFGNVVKTIGGGNVTINNIDLVMDPNMGIFNPASAPAGYAPVVNPLVQPYGIFTGTNQGAAKGGDFQSVFIHEAEHALGLQHPDRAVQNYVDNTRYTRNYDTAAGGGGAITASLSWQINEDNYFTSGLVRTIENGTSPAPAGMTKPIGDNAGSSAVLNSIAETGGIYRQVTPDDWKGIAYVYQDAGAQSMANALQTLTAARYANVIIESDYSIGAGGANDWNDDPTQATRNDDFPNAQMLTPLTQLGDTVQVLGSIAGRVNGPHSTNGDLDLFQFFAFGGDQLLFDLDEGDLIGNGVDTYLQIFDDIGNALTGKISNDLILNGDTKGGSLSARDPAFFWTVTGTGVQSFVVAVGSEGAGFDWEGDYLLNIAVVPEPGVAALVLLMLSALANRRRR